MQRSRRTSRGFSAIELIVAIGLFAVLVTLTALAQSRLLPHYRLSTATRQVITDLRLLRSKAITQNTQFRMTFTAGGGSYSAERLVGGSFQQYALYQRGAATSGSIRPIDLPSSVTTTSAVTVTFEPRGTVTTGGSPPIVLSAPGPRTRSLSINIAGLITLG
jgi:prepilin-type N-terminal cleavage/methylation domain-containing protein